MTTTVRAGASAAVAGPERGDGIDHGTPRGYRQHHAKGVPYCGRCRKANRDEKRSYNEAKRASAAQQSWNRGKVGTPSEPRLRPTGRECPDAACGTAATEPQASAHLVVVAVDGSREPARWYCAGPCAAYGQALAEIRTLPVVDRA
ncbi:hypothetical protein AB0903_31145 [Streptomyces sp. NPDC048389]|uniref:hypothetical protein n=1 Tax=Streptomyces sp. NPDC048389 TaxID=3154622 RepID=UPI0034530AF2